MRRFWLWAKASFALPWHIAGGVAYGFDEWRFETRKRIRRRLQ